MQRRYNGRWLLAPAILITLCFLHGAFAQETTAGLLGIVKDPSGASIAKANVEVTAGGKGIWPADAVDGAGGGVDAKEVGGCLLVGGEVDAVGTPVEQVGIFIELRGEQARLAALGGDRGHVAVGVVEERLAIGGGV